MRRRQGFTLIEMAITLSILAIAIAISIPYFRHHQLMRNLEQNQREFAATLQFAKQMAVAQGGTTLTINPPDIKLTNGSGQLLRAMQVSSDVKLTAPATTVTFAANGTASVGGTFIFGADGTSCTVTLVKSTGAVTQ